MELKNFFAQDTAGNVIPNPTVYVYEPDTTTLATGLVDKNGGALANPFSGTAQGMVQFAAPDGEYDLRVAGGGRDFTIRIQCLDASTVVTEAEAARDAAVAAKNDAEAAAAALASLELADLVDVDFTPAPTGGQVLAFNGTTNKWEPYTLPGDDPQTAYTDTAQTFTAAQRGQQLTDNDLSFDLSAKNNFKCTPSGSGTLTFTNIAAAAGQSGFIQLVMGSSYTISKAANVKCSATMLATISAPGTFLLSYFCDGTDVFVVSSEALS